MDNPSTDTLPSSAPSVVPGPAKSPPKSASLRQKIRSLRSPIRLAIAAAIGIAAIAFLIWLFDKVFFYYLARHYINEVADVLGISKYLAKAITIVAFVATVVFIKLALSFSQTRRRIGVLGVLFLLVGQSLVLWYATKDNPFDRTGKALRCYIVTRDTIRYGDHAGFDANTGLECKPITPEIAERIRRYENGERPKRVIDPNPTFFDQRTGNPIVWYYQNKIGLVEIFDLFGFHPVTSDPLIAITPKIAELWMTQQNSPKRVYPGDDFIFFDPVTGSPRLWYQRAAAGEYEFFDRAGFDPQTGKALTVVTAAVLSEWNHYKTDHPSSQCYMLTKDSVRYGTTPGIDPITGLHCRPFTAELLGRLREYENGKRPNKIITSNPTFNDSRSGEPLLWYFKDKAGNIELYDLMGFRDTTELLAVNDDVATEWKKQNPTLATSSPRPAPKHVDITKYAPFDPLTGEPRVWYWRSSKGDYEFYDSPGYQEGTGDTLLILSKDAMSTIRDELAAIERKRLEDQQKAEEENKRHAEQELKDRLQREANEATARAKRAAELERETQAAKRCDELAANPADQRKAGDGVPFPVLKAQAAEAIDNCELATKQHPNELRFLYQLGRALESKDHKRAFAIHKQLVELHYPASYDNLGWLFIEDRKNIAEAVRLFRAGVRLGDTDSMVSLAEMIKKGYTSPADESESIIALYGRATNLGNQNAARALQVEHDNQERAAQAQYLQQEQQRQMMQIFGAIIGNISRRY